MNVTVRVDAAGVRRALAGLSDATSNRAIKRSIDRAVDATTLEAARIAYQTLNMKLADAKKVVHARKSGGLSGAIEIDAKSAPLYDFGATQLARGVKVKVLRKGARKLIAHAFIATMTRGGKGGGGAGHIGVFTRFEKGQAGRSSRLPIRQLFTTSVRQLFKGRQRLAQLKKKAVETFITTAQNQIKQAMRRGRAA